MKTARDRAIDIAWGMTAKAISRDMYVRIMVDDSSMGRALREFIDALERGIEDDRKAIAASGKPS